MVPCYSNTVGWRVPAWVSAGEQENSKGQEVGTASQGGKRGRGWRKGGGRKSIGQERQKRGWKLDFAKGKRQRGELETMEKEYGGGEFGQGRSIEKRQEM